MSAKKASQVAVSHEPCYHFKDTYKYKMEVLSEVMGIALGDTVTLQGGGWGGEVCEVMRLDEGFNSNGECTAAFRILATNKTYTIARDNIEYATPASTDIASNAKATVSKDAAKDSPPAAKDHPKPLLRPYST